VGARGGKERREGEGEQGRRTASAKAARGEPGCAARGAVPAGGEDGVLRPAQPWGDGAAARAAPRCATGVIAPRSGATAGLLLRETDPWLGYCLEKRVPMGVIAWRNGPTAGLSFKKLVHVWVIT